MAWSDPGDFTAGQVLTAAQMDSIREAMFFGQATFTNEAARDAAIPAAGITLQEGMRAYLTAPTVPAAAGEFTSVPSGITTIYNGSSWVSTTPVSARTTNLGQTTSPNFTGTLTGTPGTNPEVTLTTGTTALVTFGANIQCSGGFYAIVSFAVSGATTIAASDAISVVSSLNTETVQQYSVILTGLTAGTNTFTLNYRVTGGTGTIYRRVITAQGVA